MNNESNTNKIARWLKNSITARMFVIGILSLVLLIPLAMIEDLIKERSQRKQSVVNEITEKWGEPVTIYGPVLKIPYRLFREKQITNLKNGMTTETIEEIKHLYLFPDHLNIHSSVDPELKKRGIYKTVVYKSSSELKGSFSVSAIQNEDNPEANILWEKTKIILNTSNLKGVNEQMNIEINNKIYSFSSKYQAQNREQLPGKELFLMESAAFSEMEFNKDNPLEFKMEISINGSSEISFVPIGKTTEATIKSDWKTNSFKGNFLPFNADKITENGFNAKWKVLDINRPFPQVFENHLPDLTQYSFGVDLMVPVDEYQKSERATKYGFLVIGLTFLLFFLIQTISKIPIHPFQYLMIGLGLVMFYTLLISISEHSSFLKAYLIAGISVILMISLFSKSILEGWKFSLFIGASLLALYSFIYIIIQLESYALLVGSIGLFIILAGVMYVSRKIDWNNY
ncbi:cell envelope integrity protein CreD [Christiangramia sp.]|uniref:cell envelope integrity protein CreD n=1 Tax=Christiangramia sp. TaxID=1931228 RepID=UPI00260BAF72|nr:cell envelope integrity protein CreD [Christiangramia sp.]